MSPGYKTYWRSPGQFGVPPSVDWTGSTNIVGLDVRWPVPERFQDSAGYSIGYVGEVVIQISVQPVDPSRPVMVVLKLDYAVCEKICIPAQGEASLWLEPGVTTVTSNSRARSITSWGSDLRSSSFQRGCAVRPMTIRVTLR